MMPLCTIATRSVAIGWALRSDGLPWVAQRVWPMPIVPGQRLRAEPRLEVDQLALGPAAVDVAVDQGGDARRVVAAIFQPLQRLDQQGRDGGLADDSDDAAHGMPSRKGLLVARPLGGRCTSFQFGTKYRLGCGSSLARRG